MNMPAKKDLQEAASRFRHAEIALNDIADKIDAANYLLCDEVAYDVARMAEILALRLKILANRCYGYLDLEEEASKDG